MKTHSVFQYFEKTYQTSLSYALPDKKPAGHFYAHNRIYGSLQEYQNQERFFQRHFMLSEENVLSISKLLRPGAQSNRGKFASEGWPPKTIISYFTVEH